MRLFVAVGFDRETEDRLARQVARLRDFSTAGSFTRPGNLHLTLAFIGETDRFARAKSALESVKAQAFTLVIGGAGRFHRSGGDIWWVGAEGGDGLSALQRAVCGALEAEGFCLETRPYRPHLTIGRRVKVAPNFDEGAFAAAVPRWATDVSEISLMQSHRVEGLLTYTPLVTRKLEELK